MKSVKVFCKQHPKYKAKRKPTAECVTCQFLWMAKQISLSVHAIEDELRRAHAHR